MRGRWRNGDDRGSLEGVLVAGFLVGVVIPALLQFGAWYQAATAAKIAATQGATAASYAGAPIGDGETIALEFLKQHASNELRDPDAQASTDGWRVHVEVTGSARRIVPLVPLAVLGEADKLVERFRPEAER